MVEFALLLTAVAIIGLVFFLSFREERRKKKEMDRRHKRDWDKFNEIQNQIAKAREVKTKPTNSAPKASSRSVRRRVGDSADYVRDSVHHSTHDGSPSFSSASNGSGGSSCYSGSSDSGSSSSGGCDF